MTLIADLLAENALLEVLDFNGSLIGAATSSLAAAISPGTMPLTTLRLAENGINVALGVELVEAIAAGAPMLRELDLSGNPLCGVEEGGLDEFSVDCVHALCDWLLGDGVVLHCLSLMDIALCGQARLVVLFLIKRRR